MDATATLRAGLMPLGHAASDAQLEKLLGWLRLLQKWNRAYNLTAVVPARMIPHLVLVSAAAAPHVRGDEVLDVGSGAGVPGIVLAVLAPERRYTLLDSNGKKTRFLEHCRMDLSLENVVVVRDRAETFRPQPLFDTIISRAYARLADFIATTRHLGRPGALWLALKGAVAASEFEEMQRDWAKYGARYQARSLHVPNVRSPTTLLSVEVDA